jgi:hypothetical protein
MSDSGLTPADWLTDAVATVNQVVATANENLPPEFRFRIAWAREPEDTGDEEPCRRGMLNWNGERFEITVWPDLWYGVNSPALEICVGDDNPEFDDFSPKLVIDGLTWKQFVTTMNDSCRRLHIYRGQRR